LAIFWLRVGLWETDEQSACFRQYLLFSGHDTPVKCELSPPHQQMTICNSRAQFDPFVAKYLTE